MSFGDVDSMMASLQNDLDSVISVMTEEKSERGVVLAGIAAERIDARPAYRAAAAPTSSAYSSPVLNLADDLAVEVGRVQRSALPAATSAPSVHVGRHGSVSIDYAAPAPRFASLAGRSHPLTATVRADMDARSYTPPIEPSYAAPIVALSDFEAYAPAAAAAHSRAQRRQRTAANIPQPAVHVGRDGGVSIDYNISPSRRAPPPAVAHTSPPYGLRLAATTAYPLLSVDAIDDAANGVDGDSDDLSYNIYSGSTTTATATSASGTAAIALVSPPQPQQRARSAPPPLHALSPDPRTVVFSAISPRVSPSLARRLEAATASPAERAERREQLEHLEEQVRREKWRADSAVRALEMRQSNDAMAERLGLGLTAAHSAADAAANADIAAAEIAADARATAAADVSDLNTELRSMLAGSMMELKKSMHAAQVFERRMGVAEANASDLGARVKAAERASAEALASEGVLRGELDELAAENRGMHAALGEGRHMSEALEEELGAANARIAGLEARRAGSAGKLQEATRVAQQESAARADLQRSVGRLEEEKRQMAADHLARESQLVAAVELQERLSAALKTNSKDLVAKSNAARTLATSMKEVRRASTRPHSFAPV